jgi:hypothetical protein
MSVSSVSTKQSTSPINAPQHPFEPPGLEIEEPCDRIQNHAVLCGAMVGKANVMGQFAGKIGVVEHANVHAMVTGKSSMFFVSYQVKYSDGEVACLSPKQLFGKIQRKMSGRIQKMCSFWQYFYFHVTAELFLYRQHGVSINAESEGHPLDTTNKHIRDLTTLSDAVREANVLNRPVCRYISVNSSRNEGHLRPCFGIVK